MSSSSSSSSERKQYQKAENATFKPQQSNNTSDDDAKDECSENEENTNAGIDISKINESGRSHGSNPVHGSYTAGLWNPMTDVDKNAFNRKRLIQMFAGVLIACCGGSAYAFGIFSEQIKTSANMSQSDMTTITTVAGIISSLTYPAGFIFDRWGPQYVLMCSTVLCCVGMGLMALIFEGRVHASVYSVAAATSLNALGVGFTDCGSLMTNLFNFPINRGDVVIIQKTFFGLGSTFLSLVFEGFFRSENYIGYAIAVTGMMLGAGVFGAAVIRLPPYKRTHSEINRIAKLEDPLQREAEREFEEKAFEMYHNPRLTDRRRLNLGVTCLFATLIFFSALSIVKAYVEVSENVTIGLTCVACLCMMSFGLMLLPGNLPSFFDFKFLPDLHPPETLVDKPESEQNEEEKAESRRFLRNGSSRRHLGEYCVEDDASTVKGREYDNDENSRLLNGDDEGTNNDSLVSAKPRLEVADNDHDDANCRRGDEGGGDGRASEHFVQRASLAGNSAPIAIPKGIAPSIIPSITDKFTKSLIRPTIWAFWMMLFGIGCIGTINGNQPQIMTAANNGVFDGKANNLTVALIGVGSASGRVIIGFLQTWFQRREALLREKQLEWEAENGPYDPNAPVKDGQPDMRPVYHRWDTSVNCLMSLWPLLATVASFCLCFCPFSWFPAIFFVQSLAFGAWIAQMVLAAREMFSVDVAQHYNFIYTSSIACSLITNTAMFGTWFDQETKLHPAANGVSCAGYVCFQKSVYVISALIGVSTVTTAYISWKWVRVRRTF